MVLLKVWSDAPHTCGADTGRRHGVWPVLRHKGGHGTVGGQTKRTLSARRGSVLQTHAAAETGPSSSKPHALPARAPDRLLVSLKVGSTVPPVIHPKGLSREGERW